MWITFSAQELSTDFGRFLPRGLAQLSISLFAWGMSVFCDVSQRICPCAPPVVPPIALAGFSATAVALQRAHEVITAATVDVFSLIDDHRATVQTFISELAAIDRSFAQALGGESP